MVAILYRDVLRSRSTRMCESDRVELVGSMAASHTMGRSHSVAASYKSTLHAGP